ncbi:hypothetical protein GGR50DRAFT_693079 [Xylaria sp. CBS 124048]|nr:hypothetical protein GGR50DRAFT_693079 [Xylaria sp. CBS 124048]
MPVGPSLKQPPEEVVDAAQICMPVITLHECNTCAGMKGKGRFSKSVSVGDDYFRDDYTGCPYNSTSTGNEN